MSWRDLLQTKEENIIAPWVGGRDLISFSRKWTIEGKLPEEHGWHNFIVQTRKATWKEPAESQQDILKQKVYGYLIGDRIVPDFVKVCPNINDLVKQFERVYLIEPGLDRFVRIVAGRFCENGPLIYENLDMPIGPEEEVLNAFQDRKKTINNISGVIPALEAAFRIETWRREEAEKRRREEQERREIETRRQQIIETFGNSASRRELARTHFEDAARAALAVGGAVYLDHRQAYNKNEMVVRFRLNRSRYECTCDKDTLRIIDAGICLTAEYSTDEFAVGTKGDAWFTLESLPGVILQAQKEGKLVVFRHVD